MSAHELPSRRCRRVLAVLGAMGLSACATPGSQHVAAEARIPERWQAENAKAGSLDVHALARWWERFCDPTLSALVNAALEASPDVQTAVSKIAESRARRGLEQASLFPWLTGTTSARNSVLENRESDVTTRAQTYSSAINVSWEVDLFGKQWQKVKAATADVAEATENLHAAQVSLTAEVANAYVTLRQAEEQLAVVERSVGTRSETVQVTRWREEAGQGDTLETQQALSTLEQARAAIPSIKETIGQAHNRLALLVGRTPGGVDALVKTPRPIPSPPQRLATGIPAEALKQRPDVRAAEQAILAAVARTKSARRERLPSINISGELSVESLSSARVFTPQSVASNVLGGLTAPIFKGGEITANIQIQTEQEKQAWLAYESTVLAALSEVENALISVQRTAERLAVLARAITAAREAQQLAAQRFAAGDVDILTVLEAQRTLLSLEVEQVSTRGSETNAHIQLYKALGGGWSPR